MVVVQCQIGLVVLNEDKLTSLEKDHEIIRIRLIRVTEKYQRFYKLPYLNSFLLKRVQYENIKFSESFRVLRKATRELYPERFIQSE